MLKVNIDYAFSRLIKLFKLINVKSIVSCSYKECVSLSQFQYSQYCCNMTNTTQKYSEIIY
uniref:Uncharacterized protein n=1 Tax=Rhizophagus irregularis (strain DAOM 181602 / DAOM 197198 / MUCL 43194) TaxID=747089 RepID=U9SPH1_RHIID